MAFRIYYRCRPFIIYGLLHLRYKWRRLSNVVCSFTFSAAWGPRMRGSSSETMIFWYSAIRMWRLSYKHESCSKFTSMSMSAHYSYYYVRVYREGQPLGLWLQSVALPKHLKGQCHEIFCFWFFLWISFPPAPEFLIRTVSNFFENSRRYSQVKVRHWCQRH